VYSYDNEGHHQVDGDDISYYETKVGSGHFDPIPLTEEWLLKFGFKKERHFDLIVYAIHPTDGILRSLLAIAYHEDGEHFCNINDKWIPNKIKHVHQLQNLYFALTGEELIIKE
jgi:hypothetical protein